MTSAGASAASCSSAAWWTEYVARQIFGVGTNEHRFFRVDLSLYQYEMLFLIHITGVNVRSKVSSETSRQSGFGNMVDQ
jgi:hypothetical protein